MAPERGILGQCSSSAGPYHLHAPPWVIWFRAVGRARENRLHACAAMVSQRRRCWRARQPWSDDVMEPAYLSALAGSTIGGLTSLTASWLTQHVQFRTQLRH